MDRKAIFDQIKGGLIVSCQALEHEPLYTKEGGIMPLMQRQQHSPEQSESVQTQYVTSHRSRKQ